MIKNAMAARIRTARFILPLDVIIVHSHKVIVNEILQIVLKGIGDHIRIEVLSKPDTARESALEQIAATCRDGRAAIVVVGVVDHDPEGLRVKAKVVGEGGVHCVISGGQRRVNFIRHFQYYLL
jgi:hypothetical protein